MWRILAPRGVALLVPFVNLNHCGESITIARHATAGITEVEIIAWHILARLAPVHLVVHAFRNRSGMFKTIVPHATLASTCRGHTACMVAPQAMA